MPSTHKIDFDAKKPLEFTVGLVGEVDVGKTCLYTAYAQKSATFTNLVYGSGDKPVSNDKDPFLTLLTIKSYAVHY